LFDPFRVGAMMILSPWVATHGYSRFTPLG